MFEDYSEKAARLKQKITAVFVAMKDPRTPPLAKLCAVVTVGYALSPVDLIPDFIPVLGMLDDVLILPLLITLCIRMIPPDVMAESEIKSIDMWTDGKPKRWYYAIPVILVWALVLFLIIRRIFTPASY